MRTAPRACRRQDHATIITTSLFCACPAMSPTPASCPTPAADAIDWPWFFLTGPGQGNQTNPMGKMSSALGSSPYFSSTLLSSCCDRHVPVSLEPGGRGGSLIPDLQIRGTHHPMLLHHALSAVYRPESAAPRHPCGIASAAKHPSAFATGTRPVSPCGLWKCVMLAACLPSAWQLWPSYRCSSTWSAEGWPGTRLAQKRRPR